MPVTMQIAEEGRIVIVTFVDPWQAHEMHPLFQQDRAHRDAFQQQHPGEKIHLISDFTQTKNAPQGMLRAVQSPSLSHPTSGMTVVVGASPFIRTIASTGFRTIRYNRAQFVDTLEAAFDCLREIMNEPLT